MHRHVITIQADATVRQCAEKISSERVGSLIVLDNKDPVGIITDRSFAELFKQGNPNPDMIKASDFMSSPLITANANTDFASALRLLNRKNIKRLPILKGRRIIGLLTLKNMIVFSNLSLNRKVQKQNKIKKEAHTDALTGLLNKNAITKAISKEFERIQRFGGRSSALFIDLDHFKNVNDTHTHLAGDVVLKEIGVLLKKTCRQIDTIGRFGGEEFIVIAPNRKKYHAVKFGERLRNAVEEHEFKWKDNSIRLTTSIGIASLFEGRDYQTVLERADRALYHAKHMGRNRIGLWREGRLSIATEHMPEQDPAQ